jgi:hypothetical protein
MSSFKDDFEALIRRIEAGRDASHASAEPIFYLVFDPADSLEVKRQLPAWMAGLRNLGWQVETFSMAEHVLDILGTAPLRHIWLKAGDHQGPCDWEKTNRSLANELAGLGQLQQRLEAALARLDAGSRTILLVTDLEALHPYLRIGAIEAQLHGRFHVPTVFLYPGSRTGTSKLRFLGFYPEDGNYRSVHIGG